MNKKKEEEEERGSGESGAEGEGEPQERCCIKKDTFINNHKSPPLLLC